MKYSKSFSASCTTCRKIHVSSMIFVLVSKHNYEIWRNSSRISLIFYPQASQWLKLSYRIAARISDTTVPPVAGASTQS